MKRDTGNSRVKKDKHKSLKENVENRAEKNGNAQIDVCPSVVNYFPVEREFY